MRRNKSAMFISAAGLVVTLSASFIVMLVMIFLMSETPKETIYHFFAGPLANRYYLGNMFNASIPLILTGLGISLAFRSSMFNLGGEGQVYAGGLAATAVCLVMSSAPGFIGIILSIIAAVIVGAIIAGLSGLFKMKWKTDELISSFLISNALIFIVDFFITGPLDDPQNNLLATGRIAEQFWLKKIFLPSNLDISIFLALIIAFFAFLYLFKTHQGYEMRMCGLNSEFARYGGINTGFYMVLPMILSGALHGLAGSVSILGTHHMAIKGFTGGIGWSGIAAALIAKNNPLAVIPAALFLAYIEAGAKSAMINSDITIEIALVVKSVVFFLITAKVIYNFAKYRKGRP